MKEKNSFQVNKILCFENCSKHIFQEISNLIKDKGNINNEAEEFEHLTLETFSGKSDSFKEGFKITFFFLNTDQMHQDRQKVNKDKWNMCAQIKKENYETIKVVWEVNEDNTNYRFSRT